MSNTNNIFSLSRFGLLVKREFLMRKSFLAYISTTMLIVTILITIFVMLNEHNYRHWDAKDQFELFIPLFIIFGILFNGTAFPAFRSNKKTLDYILTPNSITEKYSFEFLFRIMLFPIAFTIVYWIGSNLSGFIANSVVANHYDFSYNILTPFIELKDFTDFKEAHIATYLGILFVASIPFAGAAFFSGNPLPKTAVFVAILFAIILSYGWFIDEVIHFRMRNSPFKHTSKETASNIISFILAISTLVLHTTVFLRLKEKEV